MILRRSLVITVAAAVVTGCTTIQQVAALRSVGFRIDRVTELELAGVDFSQARSSSDVSLGDSARVATALVAGELPLSFDLHLVAENPASNSVTARLVQLRWTLFLEDTETVSGQIDREYQLRPGDPTDIPVNVSLDLVDFYNRSGQDVIDLALNLAGAGGAPKNVSIRAVPTINTPLGPISYPRPITIVSGSVGRSDPG